MAFNPFHTFRKHQKVIFAVLTILCMFIFVFTWGAGDITSRGKSWFGGGKASGDFVATVYGTKVYTGNVGQWRQDRQMANLFILYLRNMAVEAIANDPRGKQEKADTHLQEVLNFLRASPAQLANVPQNQLFSYIFSISRSLEAMQSELKDKPGKEDDRKFLDEVAEALKIKQSMLFFGGDFFGSPTPEELLDFQLWKHQADKLGIVLTHNAVRELLQRDSAGRNVLPEGNFLANARFRDSMKSFIDKFGTVYGESQILDALADEYRVIMAQEALVGQSFSYQGGGRFGGSTDMLPATFTPGEYLQYFREQRTTVKAALLPIPVESFEKDITATPTAKQLRDLFDTYKDKEPAPSQPFPGFTEPRELRVQYIRIDTKDDFYQNLAKKYLASTAMSQASEAIKREFQAGYGAALTGSSLGSWITVAAPIAGDPVLREYADYFGHFQSGSDDVKRGVASGRKVAPDVYDPHFDAASAMGHLLGVAAQGNPFAASAAITSTKRVHNQEQARGIGAVILAGTSPTPGLGSDLQTVTNYVQPLQQIDSFIVERTRNQMAQAFAFTNREKFMKEIEDLRAKPEEAKQAIERLAKEFHFQVATMEKPKNQWSIANDPALKDLRAAFAKEGVTTDEQFASIFFQLQGVFEFRTSFRDRFNPNGPLQTVLNTVEGSDHESYLYWLVENIPARPRSFEEAKPDVIQAWKREQARNLARKRAVEIQDKIRQQTWPGDDSTRQREVEAFLNNLGHGKAFIMNNIARMVERDTPNPDKEKEYSPFEVKETDIKYPPKNFADIVVGLSRPGDATYFQNLPRTVVYVVVQVSRSEPTYDDFKRSIARASEHTGPDRIWTNFVAAQRDDFTKNFLEKMRQEAAPEQVTDGKWVLPDGLKQGNQRFVPEDM